MWEQRRRGFTLIELLVVIAIIGLLSTLAVVALSSAREKARDAKRVADVKSIQSSLELYANQVGGYPSVGDTAEAIAGKCMSSGGGIGAECSSGTTYLAKIPANPSPGGIVYTYVGTGCTGDPKVCTDYELVFQLEGKTGDFAGGVKCTAKSGETTCAQAQ